MTCIAPPDSALPPLGDPNTPRNLTLLSAPGAAVMCGFEVCGAVGPDGGPQVQGYPRCALFFFLYFFFFFFFFFFLFCEMVIFFFF
jgi:hypothetical protein